ncbi:hypothetical protein Tco_0264707 [Tanacetum coccineum]
MSTIRFSLSARAKWVSALEEVATKFDLLPPSFLFSPSIDKLGPRFRDQATVLTVLYSTTDIVVSYPATDDIVVSCSLWFVTIVEPMSFAAAAATLQSNGLRNDTTPPLRSISRIKSSSRHEVTIPNPVFRCSEIWGCDTEFVHGFAPLESSLSQLVLVSAPLGLHLVSALVHVESIVVHLESALVHLAIQTI